MIDFLHAPDLEVLSNGCVWLALILDGALLSTSVGGRARRQACQICLTVRLSDPSRAARHVRLTVAMT